MKKIRWYDYLTINIYWLGLTTISQTNGYVQPLLVQRFVDEDQKASFYGDLRLYGLMVALLVQALAGLLSDRSPSRWGRRRPFILVGTLLNMLFIIAMGASPTYWFLFGTAILSQIASNIAHGAEQGLIPDLVPEGHRGRFSAVKALLELMPVIIVGRIFGMLIAEGHMWASIIAAVGILFLSMAITMFAREEPLREPPSRIEWNPFVRLVAMTLSFTAIILILKAAVNGASRLLDHFNVQSIPSLLLVMGGVGLLAMATAVIVGVWASVRISIGRQGTQQHPSFSWWVINRLAFLVGATNLSTFAIYFLQARLGLIGEAAADPAAHLTMIVGILILICTLLGGWMADWVGHKRLLIISGIVGAIGAFIIVLSPNLAWMYVGGSVIGAATGIFFTSSWAFGTDVVPSAEAGKYLGISNLAGAGAGAVGGSIGGPIADYFTRRVPDSPGLGYVLVFAIYGFLILISALVLLQVKHSHPVSPMPSETKEPD